MTESELIKLEHECQIVGHDLDSDGLLGRCWRCHPNEWSHFNEFVEMLDAAVTTDSPEKRAQARWNRAESITLRAAYACFVLLVVLAWCVATL